MLDKNKLQKLYALSRQKRIIDSFVGLGLLFLAVWGCFDFFTKFYPAPLVRDVIFYIVITFIVFFILMVVLTTDNKDKKQMY